MERDVAKSLLQDYFVAEVLEKLRDCLHLTVSINHLR